jgi:hypothetical protein
MFFVPGKLHRSYTAIPEADDCAETEDYFHRTRQQSSIDALRSKEEKYLAAAAQRLKDKYDEPKQVSPPAA